MIRNLVVAMSVLGFVSCPVFAATTDAKVKHHPRSHHQRPHHKMVTHEHEVIEHVDYKDMMPEPAVCTISQNTLRPVLKNNSLFIEIPRIQSYVSVYRNKIYQKRLN